MVVHPNDKFRKKVLHQLEDIDVSDIGKMFMMMFGGDPSRMDTLRKEVTLYSNSRVQSFHTN